MLDNKQIHTIIGQSINLTKDFIFRNFEGHQIPFEVFESQMQTHFTNMFNLVKNIQINTVNALTVVKTSQVQPMQQPQVNNDGVVLPPQGVNQR